ncbi:MAG: hypothetical protein HYY24_00950 [Verrucomicrobia bacterium]|nr:hypothetical protein [Verrucomicrobiota bacterium]
MEPLKSTGNDPALSQLLGEWRVNASLPPRFREQVWQRITRSEQARTARRWLALREWLEGALRRPAFAASYVAVLLVAGLVAGYAQARAEKSRAENAWRTRYVQTVDPFQGPRQ